MKITKEQLKTIIKEELKKNLTEAPQQIMWNDPDDELSGFKIKKNKNTKKPSLEHLQWLADEKLKKMGTVNPRYDRTDKYVDAKSAKLLKIYDDVNALIKYFTNL